MEYGFAFFIGLLAVLAILRRMGRLPLVRGQAARRLINFTMVLGASAVVGMAFLMYALTR